MVKVFLCIYSSMKLGLDDPVFRAITTVLYNQVHWLPGNTFGVPFLKTCISVDMNVPL
jgi:hypothetical protein